LQSYRKQVLSSTLTRRTGFPTRKKRTVLLRRLHNYHITTMTKKSKLTDTSAINIPIRPDSQRNLLLRSNNIDSVSSPSRPRMNVGKTLILLFHRNAKMNAEFHQYTNDICLKLSTFPCQISYVFSYIFSYRCTYTDTNLQTSHAILIKENRSCNN
jgi:hypothetical protein